jgi:hypothetical protein
MTERLHTETLADALPVAAESLAGDVSMWNPPTPPRTPREALEAAIAAAIELLDSAEMQDIDLEDVGDFEPEGDAEPSLGAPEHHPSQPPVYRYAARVSRGPEDDQSDWAAGDRAAERDECEGPEDDLEPSLGSIGSYSPSAIPQTYWAHTACDEHGRAYADEAEKEDEHGGDINDEGEAMLGSTAAMNQERAWSPGGLFCGHPTCEDEPSLGWSDSRGHPKPVPFGGLDDREQNADDEGEPDWFTGELEEDGHFLHCGGGDLPCLDQSVEGASNVMAADGRSVDFGTPEAAIAREQFAMRNAAARFTAIVARVRQAGEPQPEPLPGVVDIIGPAELAGELVRITPLR